MSLQKFRAAERFEFPNGAIGWRPGGPFDCLGPYAKVEGCPVDGFHELRRTCYATGYADTFFSVPAGFTIKGFSVRGFFTLDDGAIRFRPYTRYAYAIEVLQGTYSAEVSA